MKSDLPKVLHKIAGLSMVSHVIRVAESLKPAKIIVVSGPNMPALATEVDGKAEIAIQKTAQGTGDAVKAALPKLKGFTGDVIILNGDGPLITATTLKKLIAAKGKDLLGGLSVLGMQMDDPKGYGRLIRNPDKSLARIVEDKDASPAERQVQICNAGAYCVDGRRLPKWIKQINNKNAQGEYYLTDMVEWAAKDGAVCQVFVTPNAREVLGCNDRAQLAELEGIMQTRMRAAHMANGVTLQDPASIYFSYDTKIGKDCIIEPGVYFGPGVKIASHVHIKAYSHIEGAQIKSGAIIGPFARLRPGTKLEENTKVGNFSEIKNSRIGHGSKINHLSYVGDCVMGSDTNFSAGAIIANYDGFQKYQTKIGKNVMVGVNANLVSPLTIDDGAFVAAGSTITENVPTDSLSLERAETKIKKGWAALYRKRKKAAVKKK